MIWWGRSLVLSLSLLSAACLRTRTESLLPCFDQAAKETGVPRDLLLAVAYTDSRWQEMKGAPTRGWMRLTQWCKKRHPKAAAARLGVTPELLQRDACVATRGAARLLADAAHETGVSPQTPLADWGPALARYHCVSNSILDGLYAQEVLATLASGVRGKSDRGDEVNIPAAGFTPPVLSLDALVRPPDAMGPAVPFWPAAPPTHRPVPDIPRQVKYIVIHTMEGKFATSINYFRQPNTAVASHYLIRSHDGLIVQMVDERAVSFHDGCFNEESIGIEHEGFIENGKRWYSEAMYRASAALVADIAARHGIPLDRQHILGHGETPDCSEHTDPGPDWDWDRYLNYVRTAKPR
jgi:hypothetical protein